MKGFQVLIVCLLVSATGYAEDWLIRSARLLDFTTGGFTEPLQVVVRDGKIEKIVPRQAAQSNIGVIDAGGKYLVPGFTEMHAHVPPGDPDSPALQRLLFLYAAHGITTIRGMLGHPDHLALREALEKNALVGPRLITSGPSFNGRSVEGAKQAVAMVKAQKNAGYDFLKIHPGMSDVEFNAMAAEANALGIPYAGHITAETGIVKAVALQQATIDHLDGVMEELARRSGVADLSNGGFFGVNLVAGVDARHINPLARELARTRVAMVPTESLMYGFLSPESPEQSARAEAVALMPKATVDNWRRTRRSVHDNPAYSAAAVEQFLSLRRQFLSAFVQAGGLWLLGSDAPQVFTVPGDSIHFEMQLMSQAGIGNLAILKAASLAPATFFGRAEQFGSLAVGSDADFVMLGENPLVDIGNTRSIEGVMVRGRWLSGAHIARRLNEMRRQ